MSYVVEASFRLTGRAGPGENEKKFSEMFLRRLRKGQHFHQPYLGCRECIADVEVFEGDAKPIKESRDLGLMLYDIDFRKKARRPLFFDAQMRDGVVEVPLLKDVLSSQSRNGNGGDQ